MSILAVVAHPDDESFWMGGALALEAQAGQVDILVLSDGVGSRFSTRGQEYYAAQRRRAEHFGQACDRLGVFASCRVLLDVFPDQQSDRVPQLDINRVVETAINQLDPVMVYTHFRGDLNPDHRHVAEAVLVATRGRCGVYEAEPEWPNRAMRPFKATVRRCISTVLTVKQEACAAYVDEVRDYPHPRSWQAIERHTRNFTGIHEEAFRFTASWP